MHTTGPHLQENGVTADSFEKLAEIAKKQIVKADGPLGIVCGPITTGGTQKQVYNFQVFNAVVRGLQREGHPLFNQIPYEFGLRKLAHEWESAGNTGYCTPILEVFYQQIFETGHIKKGWFIPGWKSSSGACWEQQKLACIKADIRYLSVPEIEKYLAYEHEPEHVQKIVRLVPAF